MASGASGGGSVSPPAGGAMSGEQAWPSADPFKLKRFTEAQKAAFSRALREIQGGRKSSCWMWFVIPTPPHIVNGVEKGSRVNRKYALRSDEEAIAYLEFEADGVSLRQNYLDIMIAVRDQLRGGAKVSSLVGNFDCPKLASSVSFFERITRDMGDSELHAVLAEVVELLNTSQARGDYGR